MSSPIQSSSSLIAALNAANSSVGKTSTSASSVAGIQNQFLTMLTAQLQNQDPTNPMDNAQITSQMAQLSTVDGVNQMNATLQALTDSMQTSSAANLIGHGVLVPGSSLNLSSSQSTGGVTLTQPADSVSVTIKNSSGATVQTLQLGKQSAAGVVPFTWNGSTAAGTTAPDGSYTFTAQAVKSGVTATPVTLAYGTVNGVTPGTTGATVNVGSLGGFALSAVQQVL
jgi:flagellar basal-body rod modification protein FlgD